MNTLSDKVSTVAKLAKLSLNKDELTRFAPQLDNLLSYLDNLNELNTSQVLPTRQVTGLNNVSRPDIVVCSSIQEQLLECSPLPKELQHLVVPSVFV